MIWSKYNYLYKSKQYGKCFLYNSRTNSFISLSPSLFKQLSVIKKSHQQEVAIDALEDDIKRKLKFLAANLKMRVLLHKKNS